MVVKPKTLEPGVVARPRRKSDIFLGLAWCGSTYNFLLKNENFNNSYKKN
jgi:hypothetical protein